MFFPEFDVISDSSAGSLQNHYLVSTQLVSGTKSKISDTRSTVQTSTSVNTPSILPIFKTVSDKTSGNFFKTQIYRQFFYQPDQLMTLIVRRQIPKEAIH